MTPRSSGSAAWIVLAAALALGAALGSLAPRSSFEWQPSLALTQPWRAWTAAFAHWSGWHLAANLAGCAVVGAFGVVARVGRRSALAWFIAWPLGHAALLLQPRLTHYAGLSGVLHAGVAVVAWQLLRHEHGRPQAVGALVAAGLLAKLLLEQPWLGAARSVEGWDFPVAPIAHATGAAAGLVCAWVADALPRRTTR